ncbi:hypothetical protein F443_13135 [Phytophthora nicotianae P1569]|uniref:Uncharacterized protein n=1 Tax=Phytophthora nicotianae P1569 TaxID=1317065 RepID=V9EQV1_PHYNI|nr:hypothetical protein F443_13135 [Phytophthora nicotianae P1569]
MVYVGISVQPRKANKHAYTQRSSPGAIDTEGVGNLRSATLVVRQAKFAATK